MEAWERNSVSFQHFIQHDSTCWTESWWNVGIVFPDLKQQQFSHNEGRRESRLPKLLYVRSTSFSLEYLQSQENLQNAVFIFFENCYNFW